MENQELQKSIQLYTTYTDILCSYIVVKKEDHLIHHMILEKMEVEGV